MGVDGVLANKSVVFPWDPTARKTRSGSRGPGTHVGVSINGGSPIAGWFISWKIPLKWIDLGVPPISGNPHLP